MSTDKTQKKTFFETTIGLITGITALVAAITGLIVALHNVGYFDSKKNVEQKIDSISLKPMDAIKQELNDSILKPIKNQPFQSKKSETHFSYEINFWEGDGASTSSSGYQSIFSRDSRYIYANIYVTADIPPTEDKIINFHVKFYNGEGELKVDNPSFNCSFTHGEYSMSYYSSARLNWNPGTYLVIVLVDNVQLPNAYFKIE